MKQNKIVGSNSKDIYNVAGSVGLLAADMAFGFMPLLIPIAVTSVMGSFLIDDIFQSKWAKIFKHCELVSSSGEAPKLIRKEETDADTSYIFSIPKGFTFYDFLKNKVLIETMLRQHVILKQDNYKVVIKTFKKDSMEYKWNQIFLSCGLCNNFKETPELIEIEETEIGDRFVFKLPYGFSPDLFERVKSILETAISQPLQFGIDNNKLIAQVYNMKYEKFYKLLSFPKNHINDLNFLLGIELTVNGPEVRILELNRSCSHMLVCGNSGLGKTAFLLNLITQAMLKKNCEVYVSDLKASGDWVIFEGSKNMKQLVYGIKETEKLIDKLLSIKNNRYTKLRENAIRNQGDYNKRFPHDKMPNIIVVIEEFVILNGKKNIEEKLYELLCQASAAGIYIILSVQRPCAKSLDTRLKSLLGYTISFKAKNCSTSEVYLDKGDYRASQELHAQGEAICIKNDGDFYFKAFFLEEDDIMSYIKDTFVEKPKVIEMIDIQEKAKEIKIKDISKERIV